jgi:hypothetical protein
MLSRKLRKPHDGHIPVVEPKDSFASIQGDATGDLDDIPVKRTPHELEVAKEERLLGVKSYS